jgi:hypothetical protein
MVDSEEKLTFALLVPCVLPSNIDITPLSFARFQVVVLWAVRFGSF